MPVAELKSVAKKPGHEFLKIRERHTSFFIPSRGDCGEGVAPQGLKIYVKTQLFKYYNIQKFGSIPRHVPTKFAEK